MKKRKLKKDEKYCNNCKGTGILKTHRMFGEILGRDYCIECEGIGKVKLNWIEKIFGT